MMRKLVMAAALISSATDAAPAPQRPIMVYGYYSESCARVVNGVSEKQDFASSLYALGVWSGFNIAYDASTGHGTDSDGIWGEIKLYCSNHPSETLINVTLKIYNQFKTAGR